MFDINGLIIPIKRIYNYMLSTRSLLYRQVERERYCKSNDRKKDTVASNNGQCRVQNKEYYQW